MSDVGIFLLAAGILILAHTLVVCLESRPGAVLYELASMVASAAFGVLILMWVVDP